MKFLVEGLLDTSKGGTVTRIGDQNNFGKQYALKFINREGPETDILIEMAKATVEASGHLGHPAILKYFDFKLKRSFFKVTRAEILMEYVNGKSLDKLQNVTVGQWALIFKQVSAALAHMQRRKFLHGDLRPSRVMLARNGDVKVMGYGLSAVKDKTKIPFAKQYAAPEQIKEKTLDEKTDIFSLGAVMYHCLTGRAPSIGTRDIGDDGGKTSSPIALNPKITSDFNNVIVTCLQRHPSKRPESLYDVSLQMEKVAAAFKLDAEALKGIAASVEG
jgi:serine/threonine-protein kinase